MDGYGFNVHEKNFLFYPNFLARERSRPALILRGPVVVRTEFCASMIEFAPGA